MIVVIVGPTGIGKTDLSLKLAHLLNASIISADSMQIYKELNIGTGKVKDREGITHYLISHVSIKDNYSVYNYQKEGRAILDRLLKEKKNVLIVGGTGLYLKALLYDYRFQEEEKIDLSSYSLKELQEQVVNENIDFNNRRRVERELLKDKNTDYTKGNIPLYKFKIIGLTLPRKELYEKINKRVDMMFEEGLLEEAKELYEQNINTRAIKTSIGYKELYLYFEGKITLEEAKELIKKKTRNYAKRQYTFFNNQLIVKWFRQDDKELLEKVSSYLKEK